MGYFPVYPLLRGAKKSLMTVAQRVREAIEQISKSNVEGAFLPVCSAVESTAKREFPREKKTSKRFKNFVRENLPFVYLAGHGVVLPVVHLTIGPANANQKTIRVEDLIYKAVRCALVHEGQVERYISFSPNVILGQREDGYTLHSSLPWGLVFAVVLSPVNARERLAFDFPVQVVKYRFPSLNALWGQREMVREMLKSGIFFKSPVPDA